MIRFICELPESIALTGCNNRIIGLKSGNKELFNIYQNTTFDDLNLRVWFYSICENSFRYHTSDIEYIFEDDNTGMMKLIEIEFIIIVPVYAFGLFRFIIHGISPKE